MNSDNIAKGAGDLTPSAGQKHIAHPTYRRDIDGLRAAAILAVVVFHGAPTVLRGGFVGVDVFFVISGFLISNIILRSLHHGTFSFKEFYANRVRRIYPALIATTTICYIVGWFVLLPTEFAQFGKHMVASALFGQNFQLWAEAGYFDTASEQKPLLHLWSLGIEEQFYLLFPAFLWLASKGGRTGIAIIVLGVASFCWNIQQIAADPIGTFFLPHTRFWELTAGSVLAYAYSAKSAIATRILNCLISRRLTSAFRKKSGDTLNNILGYVGFGFLLLAVVGVTKQKAFPGWWALLPVVGAALLILAGPHARPNRICLGNPVFVFIGKISYPLYLWHWPVLAFAVIVEAGTPSGSIRVAAIAVSFVLAWLTYQYIERPVRFGTRTWVKTSSLCMLMIMLGVTGYVTFNEQGFREREIQREYGLLLPDSTHMDFFRYITTNFYPCSPAPLLEKALIFEGVKRCFQSSAATENSIAIIGDSHGEHLFIGIAEFFKNRQNVVAYTYPCLPFVGVMGTKGCDEIEDAFSYVLANDKVRTVVLANYWLSPWREPTIRARSDPSKTSLDDVIRITLDTTLSRLRKAGKEVYLILDIPTFPFDPVKCAPPRPFGSNRPEECEIPRSEVDSKTNNYFVLLMEVAAKYPNVHLLHANRLICNGTVCSMRDASGVLLYRDNNHLSIIGSQLVGNDIASQIAQ